MKEEKNMLKNNCAKEKKATIYDYEIAYLNGMIRAFSDKITSSEDKDVKRRIIFYVVKYFTVLDYECMDKKSLESLLIFNEVLLETVCSMTPADLVSIFPIDKKYDGYKYDIKDYFFTIEAFQSYGMDEPIRTTENAASILWDFVNINILMYQVKILGIISKLRKMDTGKELFEEFLENQGSTICKQIIS